MLPPLTLTACLLPFSLSMPALTRTPHPHRSTRSSTRSTRRRSGRARTTPSTMRARICAHSWRAATASCASTARVQRQLRHRKNLHRMKNLHRLQARVRSDESIIPPITAMTGNIAFFPPLKNHWVHFLCYRQRKSENIVSALLFSRR